MESIPFIDLQAQRRRLGSRIEEAIARVLERGDFILGKDVHALEEELAALAGARHAITCGSGTEALQLPLMAWGIGPGDAVIVPAFTFVATAEAVALVGATPVFVDVDEVSFNLDPAALEGAVAHARSLGLRPRAIIPVDLYGQPADYPAIRACADRHGLLLLADGAQSFGATLHGKPVGALADVTATSFYPAKPLGCYGDGGAMFTDDDALATLLRSLRVHGAGKAPYDNVRIGINGRMDTIQAAILREKLTIFPDELVARQRVADAYNEGLAGAVIIPRLNAGATSAWAQYTIRTDKRDALAAGLKEAGVPTAIHYPLPLSQQAGYRHYPSAPGGTAVSEQLAQTVLSLPMHPYLEAPVQQRIVDAVRKHASA
jgi:dTDP-4-amino-4,6-dideoxygalactose transaminase